MSNGSGHLPDDLSPQPLPSIRVMIIYENGAAALRAKKVLDHVAEKFHHEFVFVVEAWSFEMLRLSRVHDMVVQEASEADLVVVSSEHDTRILSEVVYGITTWHPIDHPSAVALLWQDETEKSVDIPIQFADLRCVAERTGMHLYCGGPEGSAHNLDAEVKNFGGRSIRPVPITGFHTRRSSVEAGWGINE